MTGAQYTSCLISLSLKVFLDNFTFVFGLVINLYFYKDELTLEQSLITVLKGIEILANSLREATFFLNSWKFYVFVALLTKVDLTGHTQSCFSKHCKAHMT